MHILLVGFAATFVGFLIDRGHSQITPFMISIIENTEDQGIWFPMLH